MLAPGWLHAVTIAGMKAKHQYTPDWGALRSWAQRAGIGFRRLWLTAALILLLGADICAASQEDDFLAARDAYQAHDLAKLDVYAGRLQDYVLAPYVAYWQLQSRLDQASPAEVKTFLARYGDTPIGDRLRGEWLKSLGKEQNWSLFLREYPQLQGVDKTNTCYAIQAKWATQGDVQALAQGKPLWFDGSDLPSSCGPVFDALVDRGMLDQEDIWSRFRLALQAGNVSVARAITRYLRTWTAADSRRLDAASDNPRRYLDRGPLELGTRPGREIAMFAVYRLARSQPDSAEEEWSRLQRRFSADERSYTWSQMALYAARQHDRRALSWYAEAGNYPFSEDQLAWRVRAALRLRNWNEVLSGIQAMPQDEREKSSWRYWKARALKELGQIPQANAILAPLSREYNFYGQLATEDLGQFAASQPQVYRPAEAEIQAVKALPGIQRALALYQAGMRYDGNREWIWATRGFDDKQLLAAAELARRYDWYDRSIYSADKTKVLHDFALRFPAPHWDLLRGYANQWNLDEAWVYGLIRQESRFVGEAKSSAGASGLMQLMPATARWVAQKLGLKDYRHALVTQLDTNVALGTYYLRHVMDTQDGYEVLATAAYNAGPLRAKRWRSDGPMEGAIYAESIPFSETRDYVKKVMSNAVYYAQRFGQQLASLKERLGVIGGGPATPGSADDQGK